MQRPDPNPSSSPAGSLPRDSSGIEHGVEEEAWVSRVDFGNRDAQVVDEPPPQAPEGTRPPPISYEVLARYAAWQRSSRANDDSAKIRRRLVERFEAMPAREMRALGHRVAATVRELGITPAGMDLATARHEGHPGTDILPFLFAEQEWDFISRGVSQRLEALDCYLQDIYGERQILRDRILPVDPILGSPFYQLPVVNLAGKQPYIHFGGFTVARDTKGEWLVKQHLVFEPAGLSSVVQNRRILARVASESFSDLSVVSVAEAPWQLLERLRELAPTPDAGDPMVVLLTGGPGSPTYAEHIFLGRRMGMPVVQGNELLVLRDKLYLKTVRGLRQVDVVLNRLRDEWLDPMVFRRESLLGVPGLIHCVRKGSVVVVNRPGSQLADDRALLPFTSTLIRYYLGQPPLLKSAPAYWLGDMDQRAEAMDNLDAYDIYPLTGGAPLGGGKPLSQLAPKRMAKLREEVLREPAKYVAQLRFPSEPAPCLVNGEIHSLQIDHRVYGIRNGAQFDVIPGALTRVAGRSGANPEVGHALKDTWVINRQSGSPIWQSRSTRRGPGSEHSRDTTSKEAESFYWLGRYLERINILGYMLNVVESMEAEELSTAERSLYRPTWNRLLPPLVSGEKKRRRGLSTPQNRYRLLLQPDEPASVYSMVERAIANAEDVQESITPLAWDALMQLRQEFHSTRFRPDQSDAQLASQCSSLNESVLRLIPQFFAICQDVCLLDDGWRFCSLGKFLERASTSANASTAMADTLRDQITSPSWRQVRYDIELSAFLRMMSSRDAYYRVYQMRADPVCALDILWSHPDAPRSVLFSLQRCAAILRPMPSAVSERTLQHLTDLISEIGRMDWAFYFAIRPEDTLDDREPEGYNRGRAEEMRLRATQLGRHLENLLDRIMRTHGLMSDAFLTHQQTISATRPGSSSQLILPLE